MTQPLQLYQGDTARWIENRVHPAATAVTVWLRGSGAGAGIEVQGVDTGDGWLIELLPGTTSLMAAGEWQLQVVCTVDAALLTTLDGEYVTTAGGDPLSTIGAPITTGRGSFTVRQSLAFSGSAGAFDDRSQAQKDLDAIEEAIRALVSGAVEYQIGSLGNGGRKVRRVDLPELIKWRDRLKAEVAREKRAEMIAQGLGDPRKLYVRFGGVR